jgi:hypothetical protein
LYDIKTVYPPEEGFYPDFKLRRELMYSGPPLENASELCDMVLELKDILRVLDRRLDKWSTTVHVEPLAQLTSTVFATLRKPAITPCKPGIGTPFKIFSSTVGASLRAGHVYFNALTAGSPMILDDCGLDLIIFSSVFIPL